jgi:feruloyl esterase
MRRFMIAATTAALFSSTAVSPSVGLGMAPATAPVVPPPASSQADRCAFLKGQQLGGARVDDAQEIAKGGALGTSFRGPYLAPRDLCRVRATASPVPGSRIAIEVWLPDAWNGKLLGLGGGGLNGGLGASDNDLTAPVGLGYAGVIDDLGHSISGEPAKWGYQNPEAIIDFGHRGNHVAALAGKAIVAAYYGRAAERSYFEGCSGGGREALMLAQRYPADYDGIIAGSPAADFTGLMTMATWHAVRAQRMPAAATFPAKLQLLRNAAVHDCDQLDGVIDGVIGDPRTCRFDPAEIECKPGPAQASCLTADEVAVAREIYRGPHLSSGAGITSGASMGSEDMLGPFLTENGVGGQQLGFPFFKWLVLQDPSWSPKDFQLDRDYQRARAQLAKVVDATDPDLGGFFRRGGKLLIYHGWEDPVIPAQMTLNYYMAMRHRMGAAADGHVRLFMMPGVSHCMGGHGPSAFDKLGALDRWVEDGVAPERLIATKYDNDLAAMVGQPAKVVRTRPLCAWPKVARYSGAGSTDEAANFTCSTEQRPASRPN